VEEDKELEEILKVKQAAISTWKALLKSFPVLLSVLLLVSLSQVLIPKQAFAWFFSKNILLDSFIGSFLGSILAGNPITSYILGGELLTQGVSLMAVTAFIVAWVTVGIVQLPAEAVLLGKKFAITRNIVAFFMAVLTAIITVLLMGVFS
jgi:uncharacterized membrane protein YraQ (UPF0718 family)